MVIIIDNNLIETQYIWNVTPIEARDMDMTYRFDIKFLNDNNLRIEKNVCDDLVRRNNGTVVGLKQPSDLGMTMEELKRQVRDRVERMRDQLIDMWSISSTNIPKTGLRVHRSSGVQTAALLLQ